MTANIPKQLIKCILSILHNGISISRMSKISFPFYIGKGLTVHNPTKIHIGKNFTIGSYSRLSCYGAVDKKGITIGNNVYIGSHFSAMSGGEIKIGSNTLIASYVTVISENHGMNPECRLPYGKQPLIEKSTSIGRNCWIGEKVTILPGISIGDWSIIGACSVVTTNIPPYSIAVGNPARIIKKYNHNMHFWEKTNE